MALIQNLQIRRSKGRDYGGDTGSWKHVYVIMMYEILRNEYKKNHDYIMMNTLRPGPLLLTWIYFNPSMDK